jgi:serine/threonine protein kinase
MNDLIGKSLGRYHILEQLGEGGMATVYKAYDTRLEADVAVKVIRTENILPSVLERSLKRFEREAKALARLNHPNIVRVTDYGEYEGKPYLVMPYFPGGTLKEKLGKQIPWQETIQILLPIVEALDYAHSHNMIHRDVKPSNILLAERGQPMLSDFGIAKMLDLEETVELTGTRAAIGTPEYMAPEQATAKTVDYRADIYSLGTDYLTHLSLE